jgi:hypothetical protein
MCPTRKTTATDSFNEMALVRSEPKHSAPLIWRQVEVPTSITLKVLHDIVQTVMGWFDYHLWEFTIAGRRYGPPMQGDWGPEPRIAATKARLRDVLKQRKTTIDSLYDFGDSWELRLTVTNIRAGKAGGSYPRLVAGERNAPPEDCGGIPGFYAVLDAIADPHHPDHPDAREPLDDYDPNIIDTMQIGYGLTRIARRRNAARTRLAGNT